MENCSLSSKDMIKLYLEVEKVARFYGKIRLVVNDKLKADLKGEEKTNCGQFPANSKKFQKYWGLFKELNMNTKKINKSYKTISIPKEEYNNLKNNNNKLKYQRFNVLRDYFAIKRIQTLPPEKKEQIIITLGYRDILPPNVEMKTSNENLIKIIENTEDYLIYFNLESEFAFRMIFRHFLCSFLFNELNLFPDKEIHILKRNSLKSKNKNNKAISNRLIIYKSDKKNFELISETTYQNLLKLVDDTQLHQKLMKIHLDFERNKEGI
ncbi:MAG: hypothetical protein K9W45_11190 [Candidatus Heimdallarchaeum aukensis]|uniref:Uncharacterized protein n=1 Tax=Candidatus Heimdallarchaeum aukensis TaxID=2876573 RepID=A0A9Y1FK86_9ARCH|nr:MAG: hypothetical protein K9W45_11190 [Candidatus Heimdallarchaeum aukensis]